MSRLVALFALLLCLGCDDDTSRAVVSTYTVARGETLEIEIGEGTLYQVRTVSDGGSEAPATCYVLGEDRILSCASGVGVEGPAVVVLVEAAGYR